MSNNKQSSVEWYSNEIGKITALALSGKMTGLEWSYLQGKALEQAKAMHKEEIGDAYFLGYGDHQTLDWHDLDEYYNETFNYHEKNNKN
jgi:hypothetical protein